MERFAIQTTKPNYAAVKVAQIELSGEECAAFMGQIGKKSPQILKLYSTLK